MLGSWSDTKSFDQLREPNLRKTKSSFGRACSTVLEENHVLHKEGSTDATRENNLSVTDRHEHGDILASQVAPEARRILQGMVKQVI